MHRVEALWLKILGVLLILLGLTLFALPYVSYSTRERLGNTPLTVRRERTLVISKPVAVLIVAAGVTVFAIASRNSRQ